METNYPHETVTEIMISMQDLVLQVLIKKYFGVIVFAYGWITKIQEIYF